MPRIERDEFGCQLPTGGFCLGSMCDFCAVLRRILLLVGGDSFGEGVAMDAEHGGGVGDVLFVACERLLYIELLEFRYRFVEKDMAFQHLVD